MKFESNEEKKMDLGPIEYSRPAETIEELLKALPN